MVGRKWKKGCAKGALGRGGSGEIGVLLTIVRSGLFFPQWVNLFWSLSDRGFELWKVEKGCGLEGIGVTQGATAHHPRQSEEIKVFICHVLYRKSRLNR